MSARKATILDARRIAELGDAVVLGEDRNMITWDELAENIETYMRHPGVETFVSEREGQLKAALIGTIACVPWTHRDPIAYVMLWWSRSPHAGLSVLRAYKRWAKFHGATLLLGAARTERTERLYERMNMRRLESNYLGRL